MSRKRRTVAQLKRAEAKSRMRDFARIRAGEATAEEIQRENSMFSAEEAQNFRITNLAQVIRAICKQPVPR